MAGKTSNIRPDDVVHATRALKGAKRLLHGRTVREVMEAGETKRAGLVDLAGMIRRGEVEVHAAS